MDDTLAMDHAVLRTYAGTYKPSPTIAKNFRHDGRFMPYFMRHESSMDIATSKKETAFMQNCTVDLLSQAFVQRCGGTNIPTTVDGCSHAGANTPTVSNISGGATALVSRSNVGLI